MAAKCQTGYKILKNCNKKGVTIFCTELISENSCLKNVLNTYKANCSELTAHLPPISEISDGIIVINDAKVTVKPLGKNSTQIDGTYLITFKDTVFINETLFTNQKGRISQSPQLPMAHYINITEHIQELSLPVLNELNLKNLYHIKTMGERFTIHTTVYNSLFLTITFSIIALLLFMVIKRKFKPKAGNINDILKAFQEKLRKAEDDFLSRGGVVNTAGDAASSHENNC